MTIRRQKNRQLVKLQKFAYALASGDIIDRRFIPHAFEFSPHPELEATIRRMTPSPGQSLPTVERIVLEVCAIHGLPDDVLELPRASSILIACRCDCAIAIKRLHASMSLRRIAIAVGYTSYSRIWQAIRQFGSREFAA